MDHQPTPSADDLGISDVEYERILRDMRRRRGLDLPAPTTDGLQPERRSKGLAVVLGLVVVILVVFGLAGTGDGPSYQFLETVDGKHPVAYSSCRLIQVAVYPAGGPPDAEALVREAVTQMRSATGLDIVVSGVFGGYAAQWNFKAAPVQPGDPISISWQDGDAIADMTDHTAGLGGSPIFNGRDGIRYRSAGTIALSRQYYAGLSQRGDHDEALAVLLHEFGHVFGLDHVNRRDELMYQDNVGRTSLGKGDLEGLRQLGRGPCA